MPFLFVFPELTSCTTSHLICSAPLLKNQQQPKQPSNKKKPQHPPKKSPNKQKNPRLPKPTKPQTLCSKRNTKLLIQATPYIRTLGPFDTSCYTSRVKAAWACIHPAFCFFRRLFELLWRGLSCCWASVIQDSLLVTSTNLGWDYFAVGPSSAIYPFCFCWVSFHLDNFSNFF